MEEQNGRDHHNEKNRFKRKKDGNGKVVEDSAPPNSQQENSGKKKRKEVAIFGNYRNYYGYRVGRDLDEDPRLKAMKREWFEDKDCLDIGCNSGLITIAIAKKFGCRSILGVDIDGARIEDAYWTVRKIAKMSTQSVSSKNHNNTEMVRGAAVEDQTSLQMVDKREKSGSCPQVQNDLLKVVSFQKGNFVQNWRPPANTFYHAILCLSVSKWVHLNWGDDGLITLFWRAWMLLHPGGVFILEPQPWSSYFNNRSVSEAAASNYKTIEIRPEDFQDILLDKIGFQRVENITSNLQGSKVGFNRPILAFWK